MLKTEVTWARNGLTFPVEVAKKSGFSSWELCCLYAVEILAQCGNWRIFQLLRFYVKSILSQFWILKTAILRIFQFSEFLILIIKINFTENLPLRKILRFPHCVTGWKANKNLLFINVRMLAQDISSDVLFFIFWSLFPCLWKRRLPISINLPNSNCETF